MNANLSGSPRAVSARLYGLTSSRLPVHLNQPVVTTDHQARYLEMVQVTFVRSGRGIHRTLRGEQSLALGDGFVIGRPGTWHAYRRCRNLHVYNCCFTHELIRRDLPWLYEDPAVARLLDGESSGISRVRLSSTSLKRCVELHDAIVSSLHRRSSAVVSVLGRIAVLLFEFAQALRSASPQADSCVRPVHPAVRRAKQMLDGTLKYPWTLEELSGRANLNKSYLIRLFKAHLGASPMQYLMAARLDAAASRLMRSDEPIGAIARSVGLDEPAHFARLFKRRFGCSATAYRAREPEWRA